MLNNEVELRVLEENDIDILTRIMERAFDVDTKMHTNDEKGGPTGYNNGDFLRKFALQKQSSAYTIMQNKNIVGCVIVWVNKESKINYLGNIFIDPCIQNKGIGFKVWNIIEDKYKCTKKWCTETPGYSRRNHNFYVNKCGFHVVKINNPMDELQSSFILEKVMMGEEMDD
ncbi:GNAT family N-acetyltransferase [Clostridium sp.]|uniref:GNAT family N-acetyltransferase n=1 Tax=Clostridium sp. TaxID=1506 RepID=UPI002FCC75A9